MAAVLRQSPPAYFFYGRHSFLMPFLKRWLPPFVTVRPATGRARTRTWGALTGLRRLDQKRSVCTAAMQDWIALRVFGLLGFVAIARSTDWSKVKKA